MTEHKWAHILRAIADGKEVEFLQLAPGEWASPASASQNPINFPGWEWRIKPTEQEKPMSLDERLPFVDQKAPMPTPHIHAASMLLYAQDAAETDKPWERWEYRREDSDYKWLTCGAGVCWYDDSEYRRKPPAPKMLKVTTNSGRVLEFPEPMKTAPADGEIYFCVDITGSGLSSRVTWNSDNIDKLWFSRGLCHLTCEAAEQHAAALLAVTRGE